MQGRLLVMVVLGCGCGNVKATVPDDASMGGSDAAVDAPDAGIDASPARAWQLVQATGAENTMTSPGLTIPLRALGAGHLVVVAVEIVPAGRVTSMTDDSGCNHYNLVPMSHASSTTIDAAMELYYATNSCAGATAIDIAAATTGSPALVFAAVVWEVSGIKTANPLDTAAALNNQLASTAPLGPRIATSAPGEFVVAVALADNEITGIRPGNEFMTDHDANGNGWAHLSDPNAPAGVHQAQWDQSPSGAYCSSAAAFQVGP